MKCPYCTIEYNSSESYQAHVAFCAHKKNPIVVKEEPVKTEVKESKVAGRKISSRAKKEG